MTVTHDATRGWPSAGWFDDLESADDDELGFPVTAAQPLR